MKHTTIVETIVRVDHCRIAQIFFSDFDARFLPHLTTCGSSNTFTLVDAAAVSIPFALTGFSLFAAQEHMSFSGGEDERCARLQHVFFHYRHLFAFSASSISGRPALLQKSTFAMSTDDA
jgi:hypothetical protein